MRALQYKESEIEIIIDYSVLKKFTSKHSLKLSEIENVINDLTMSESLAFEAIKRGYQLQGEKCEYKLQDIEDILNQPGNFALFIQEFNESIINMFQVPEKDKKK